MIRISFLCFLLGFSFGFQTNSCNPTKPTDNANNEYGEMTKIGPGESTSLVLFYKKGTTHDQIELFEANVTSVPRLDNRGRDLPEGVVSTYSVRNRDYEGMGINFRPNATLEQREKLKKAIEDSPIVYKIYENVTPDTIKDL